MLGDAIIDAGLEDLLTRSLHNQTATSIQRRLEFSGIQVIVLPIRVWETAGAA